MALMAFTGMASGDSNMKRTLLTACLLTAVVPLAHATTVRGDKLPPPKKMTCLQVKQAISILSTRGLLHIPYDVELGPGAYVSEHEDANGVYYRAPEEAITERRTDVKPTSRAGRAMTFDGGIYVPNDPAVAPTLYKYYATYSAVTQPVPSDTDCSTLAYTVDPHTQKVSVVATGMVVGVGAATGMVTSRYVHPHIHTSYGQAAGAGLAGGLIAGLIIGAIENSKVGEILPGPELDSQAQEKIKALVANKVALGELEHSGDSNVAATAPKQPVASASATQAAATPAAASTAMQTTAVVQPAASTSAPTPAASPASTIAVAEVATSSLAQTVASQMGCGAVKAYGDQGYVAPCGTHGVYIGCDGGQCRPLHTIKLDDDQ
jgi:hypothetical protein